jgi:hypothetical protein
MRSLHVNPGDPAIDGFREAMAVVAHYDQYYTQAQQPVEQTGRHNREYSDSDRGAG